MSATPWHNAAAPNAPTPSAPTSWLRSSSASTSKPSTPLAPEQTRHRISNALLAFLLCSPAIAQHLDLDTPGKPKPGTGVATLALADSLDKQLAQLDTSPSAPTLERAKVALRTTARNLLRVGESLGEMGNLQTLAGSTIALRLADLDAALAKPSAETETPPLADRPDLVWLAHDLTINPDAFKDTRVMDRTLRDALAPFAGPGEKLTLMPGYAWGLFELPAPPLAERSPRAGLSSDSTALFAALDAQTKAAFDSPVYRQSATGLYLDLADSLDLLARRPQPLSQEATERFRIALIAVARTQSDPTSAPDALDASRFTLRTLALSARLVSAALALDPTTGSKALLPAISQTLAAPDLFSSPAAPLRLRAALRAVELSALPDRLADEKHFPRQFRPAHRMVVQSVRQSGEQLLEILPRILRPDASPSDPAVIGALNAHEARLQTFFLFRMAGGTVVEKPGTDDPPIKPDYKTICERVLALGQDLSKPDKRELALAELRDLARDLENMRGYLKESGLLVPELRSAMTPEWSAIASRLLQSLDATRTRWLTQRSGPKMPADDSAGDQLAALIRAVKLAADASRADAMLARAKPSGVLRSPLQSAPAFELSPQALDTLCAGLREACLPVFDAAFRGDLKSTESRADQVYRTHAPALLIGNLDRTLEVRNNRGEDSPPNDAIAQLVCATPDPDRTDYAEARDDLAALCRYAEEWSTAESRKDLKSAAQFKAAAQSAAIAARAKLEKMERESRWLDRLGRD